MNITARDIVVGNNATITISSNVAGGNVTVYVNGKKFDVVLDADGNYVLNVTGLGAGNYTVIALLAESANYTAVTNSSVNFTVAKLNTTINVNNTLNVVNVTVNSTATGYCYIK